MDILILMAIYVIVATFVMALLWRRGDRYKWMALYDPLTRLANRALFDDRLTYQLGVRDNRFTVIYLDVDRFKQINDTQGHQTGDMVLCTVADVLRQVLRPSDTIARLGGDEFACIVPGIYSEDLVHVVIQRIAAKFREYHLSVSLGYARFPVDAMTKEALVGIADQSMYAIKRGEVS